MPLDPTKQAGDAAEAIRRLNHATLTPKQPIPAPVISSTVQSLGQLVARLPQALCQLSEQLDRDRAKDLIRMDNGTDPGPAVSVTRSELAATVQALNAATHHLDEAATWLFNMGIP